MPQLPEWYLRANATDAEIDTWLDAKAPPYVEMQNALPWLYYSHQFDAWIDGARAGRRGIIDNPNLSNCFPGIAAIPLPPRRTARKERQQ
jgi:hypothetical protein